MADTILVINAGSSSIKFSLYAIAGGTWLQRCMKGQIDGIGERPRLNVRNGSGKTLIDYSWSDTEVSDLSAALDRISAFLRDQLGDELPVAVGHRVVHGGPYFDRPAIVDRDVLEKLERLISIAPLHQPNNIAPIRIVLERLPQILQVACFDTAFHRGHPMVADRFAIPESLFLEGVRRYGFHGLSYEYISKRLTEFAPDIAKGRVVVAHLGSGSSMCAIQAGRSMETTMGFTTLEGLAMGTRPGQLDAGVILYLMTEKNMSPKAIEQFLYHECGLKGLSGISSDMRELLASTDPRAAMAVEFFVHRVVLFTGMLTAAMGGIDGFVFTAGIGENAPTVREAIASRLSWLGIEFDSVANDAGQCVVSTPASRVACYVIPTDEEQMIASHTFRVLKERQRLRVQSGAN